ncbi:MAG: hypothetical protein IH586_21425 [Anaerolineaceae bacterium]|nr:hypothetical protein [Anaerolineaceae bacterium]
MAFKPMMKSFFSTKLALNAFILSAAYVYICLFIVSILAYGLLIPWLHLYIDDWIWYWTWEKFGHEGLVRYFSTNRPVWGAIFQVTLPFLTRSILGSQIFSLLVRWLSSLTFWWLVKLIWPKHSHIAFYGALLFLVYPGFVLQPIALTYGHIFLIYIAFLLSFCFSLYAQNHTERFWIYTTVAVLLSLVNLLTVEFFFTLELSRPFVFFVAHTENEPDVRKRLYRVLRAWLPYLIIFLIAAGWRIFFFKYQTYNHPITFLTQLQTQPIHAVVQLCLTMAGDLFSTTIGIWFPVVERLAGLNLRLINGIAAVLIGVAAAVAVAVRVFILPGFDANQSNSSTESRRWLWQVAGLGLILLLAAGWPFWLTGLDVQPVQFNSRLTIPFIFGAALLTIALLEILPSYWLRSGVFALLIAASCGYQFQVANDFRLDWQINQKLMWQIAWRIPAMKEGTTLLITDFPTTYYNTAALSTELNAIYPSQTNRADLAYYMLYSREMERDLPGGLAAGKSISGSNVTANFKGSTGQVLAIQYDAGRCLRLLDPAFDSMDATLPEYLRKAAQISNLKWVEVNQPGAVPPKNLFGEEPARQWCYFFEKAELARQRGDWNAAARLGDEAQLAGMLPKDEIEKLVFIEAYAHVGKWDQAAEMARGFNNKEKIPMLCKTIQQIMNDLPTSAEKIKARDALFQTGRCK